MARSFTAATPHYLDNAGAVLTGAPITMACWAYFDDVTNNGVLIGLGTTANDNDYFILARWGTESDQVLAIARRTDGTQGQADSTISTTAGSWFHCAAVFTSATSRAAFTNGGNKGTNTTNITPANINNTAIGTVIRNSGPAANHNGDIAEPAIWNAALSDAEITSLAQGYSPLLIRPQNLAAYWPLIGRTSPEIDPVGGYDMTLNNAPSVEAHPPIIYLYRQVYTPPGTAPAGIPKHFMHYAKMRRG